MVPLIPDVLVLALLGGLLRPSWGAWVVTSLSVGWAVVLLVTGTVDDLPGVLGAAGLGALNSVVGFGLGSALRRTFSRWRTRAE